MKRPTKEQVEAALVWIDGDPTPDVGDVFGKDAFRTVFQPERVVAAELRALRGALERVEQLPELWRNMLELGELVQTGRAGAAVSEVVRGCAVDLEKALQGDD